MQDTRRTLGQTKEALEFQEKIEQLNADQREHLRKIISRLVDCCVEEKAHAIVVCGEDGDPRAEVFTLNCNEMDAAFMLSCLHESFLNANLADAPAKEMFN